MGVKSLFVKILKIFTSGLSFALIQEKLTELETDSLKKKNSRRVCICTQFVFSDIVLWPITYSRELNHGDNPHKRSANIKLWIALDLTHNC